MKTTLLVLLLLVSGLTFSDTTKKQPQQPTTVAAIEQPTTVSESQPDYELLYDNQVKYNDKILGTINTALAMFGVACVIVLGGSLWFNVVKYNQLKKEILDKVNESAETQKHLIDEALERLKADSIVHFQQNLNYYKDSLTVNDISIKKIMKELIELKDRINPIDASVDTLMEEMKELKNSVRGQGC